MEEVLNGKESGMRLVNCRRVMCGVVRRRVDLAWVLVETRVSLRWTMGTKLTG